MNQILFFKNMDISCEDLDTNKNNKLSKNFFKFQFIIFTSILLVLCTYYSYHLYINYQNDKLSKKLIDNFNITSLYSNNNYSTIRTSNTNFYEVNDNTFNVIGLVEINAININYPILSMINNDLLKIAPCRFYGPMPNEVGNLCIAGHNYNSYKCFSKLKNLKNGDIINIYDLSGNKVAYSVYNSYETDYNDLSCTNQDTNGKREITLITCNNIKNRRRIIKAREKI